MTSAISPIGVEVLDGPHCSDALVRATLRDLVIANALLGGRAAATWGVARVLERHQRAGAVTILDVGTGSGDIARHLRRHGERAGIGIIPVGLDRHRSAAAMCRGSGVPCMVGDVAALPFADASVDIVLASQLLHHFSRPGAIAMIRELDRIARLGVVIADLRRAPAAAAGIWLASFALGFHRVTRRDGVTSVRRGFTPAELSGLLLSAGMRARVDRRPGYRLVAVWRKDGDAGSGKRDRANADR